MIPKLQTPILSFFTLRCSRAFTITFLTLSAFILLSVVSDTSFSMPLLASPTEDVNAAPLTGEKTLILINYSQMVEAYTVNGVVPLMTRLNSFAMHPAVDGRVVFVDEAPSFSANWANWQADPANVPLAVAASNAVHGLISAERTASTEYIVLIGGDSHIPYQRIDTNLDPPATIYSKVPLGSPLGAAFLSSQLLTDDFYADPNGLSAGPPFEPTLGVGRLVETPTEIIAMMDQFSRIDGTITLESALTAGYGPMVDSAEKTCDLFMWDQLTADCELIGESWTPSMLDTKLTVQMPSLLMIYMRADHGSVNVGGGTNNQALLAERVAAWTLPISGTLAYFPVSNYAGLSAPDDATPPIDWAQMWLAGGAAFIGNTGNGLVDSNEIRFSELLGQRFLEQVVKDESIGLSEALNEAKKRYLSEMTLVDSELSAAHQKVVAQTVLYGFPMMQIVSPYGDAFDIEGDDSCSQARSLDVDESQRHTFHVAGDVDWLKVSVMEGDEYQLNLTEFGDSFAQSTIYRNCDAITTLLSTEGSATWQVSATGEYYIETRSTLSGVHGPGIGYTISLDSGRTLFLPFVVN